MPSTTLFAVLLACAALASAGSPAHAQDGKPPLPDKERPAPPPAADVRFKDADALLTELETADKDLRTLTAAVQTIVSKSDLEGGDMQVRQGKLVYSTEPEQAGAKPDGARARRFEIEFLTLISDGAKRDDHEAFIFDGRRLIEKQFEERQMYVRQIVAEGEDADPLRLGQGPFPVPIGQRKADILKRFDVSQPGRDDGWAEGKRPPALDGTWQLRLIPKAGTDEARDFRDIRIWYFEADEKAGGGRKRLLPRFARTENADGTHNEIVLAKLQVNADLPSGAFDTRVPEGWEVQNEEVRRPADKKDAGAESLRQPGS